MNVDEALREVARSRELPYAAIIWAVNHWAEVSQQLISRFESFSTCCEHTLAARVEAFHTAHLCAEKEDPTLFEPLCRLIALDRDIDLWLGDAVTETLPGILIRVFDGDVSLLQKAIEAPTGNEFARASALAALGYLVRTKSILGDAEMANYLRRLRREMKPRRQSVVWLAWAVCAANLGLAELRDEVIWLDEVGFIPDHDYPSEVFDERVKMVRRDWSGLAGFHADFVRPVSSTISALESMDRVGGRGPETTKGFEALARL